MAADAVLVVDCFAQHPFIAKSDLPQRYVGAAAALLRSFRHNLIIACGKTCLHGRADLAARIRESFRRTEFNPIAVETYQRTDDSVAIGIIDLDNYRLRQCCPDS